MQRERPKILPILSLIVCLVLVALWIRSYWAADALNWERNRYAAELRNTYHVNVASTQGRLRIKFEHVHGPIISSGLPGNIITYKIGPNGEVTDIKIPPKPAQPADRTAFAFAPSAVPAATSRQLAFQSLAGFEYAHNDLPGNEDYTLALPMWLIVLLASIFPLGRIDHYLRSRPKKKTRIELPPAFV